MQEDNTKWKKRLTILLWIVVAAAVFLAISLTHHLWQSSLFDFFGPRREKLSITSDLIQTLSPILTIIGGVITQILINMFLKPAPPQSQDLDSPLSPTTLDKILDTYSGENWRTITWIDRGIINTSYLQDHHFVVIHGQMKSGKTHEAVQLIRFAQKDGFVPRSQVFDLTGALRQFTPEEIRSRLSKELCRETSVLFFLNEIPADAGEKYLQTLEEFLKALRKCHPGYFVTTVRSEHLNHNSLLQEWLAQNEVAQVFLRPLTLEEINIMIDKLHENCIFIWDEDYRQEFVEQCDGTPYHLILTFQRLNRLEGQVNREEIKKETSQSLKDIWTNIRLEVEKTDSAAASLFKALAVCHHANVTPLTPLVFGLATWMERKKIF